MRGVVDEVDGALGCAVVDVTTGDLLGVAHDVAYFNQTYLEAVAAAAVQMFRGYTVTHVEDLISARRGVPSEHLIEEVQMTTRHTIHFMTIVPDRPDTLIVLITNRQAIVGMSWSAIRRSVLAVEPILAAGDGERAGDGR
jgi:hypothetical protein